MTILAIVGLVAIVFALGAATGYIIGRKDGYDKCDEHWKAKKTMPWSLMSDLTHAELVRLAEKWLNATRRCRVKGETYVDN